MSQGWEGGLPPPKFEWHSTRGGKPPFPTLRHSKLSETSRVNEALRVESRKAQLRHE
jgi:hypothetical protein